MTPAVCPYCRSAVTDTDERLVCEGCDTPHHRDCYDENRGCTVFGCQFAPPDEPKVHVTVADGMALYTGPPPPVLARSAPAPLAAPQPAPMPARRPVTVRSYSPLGLTAISVPSTPHAVIETAAPPAPRLSSRSKALFVLFGVFLGPLGAHNFYAGFHIKAVAQLAITVLTFGYGLPMSWLWAVIDVCTVEQDRAGAQFRA